MTWDVPYACIYAGAALGIANIFCTAPDRLKKLSLGLAAIGFAFMYAYHCAEAVGHDMHWQILDLGQQFVVWAALIEVFRVLFIERLSCKSLSGQSLRFPA